MLYSTITLVSEALVPPEVQYAGEKTENCMLELAA